MSHSTNPKLFKAVLLRLGYITPEQAANLGEEKDDQLEKALIDDNVVTEKQLGLANRLVDRLPSDASNSQIDEEVINAFASLDETINPSLIGQADFYKTDLDPRVAPTEPEDNLATTAPQDLDPHRTIPPEAESLQTTGSSGSTNRFKIIRRHAEGGLGLVSLAEDMHFGRDVAVKEIKEGFAYNPQNRSRFIYEAEITGRLEHPGVVPVYAIGRHQDGRPYYAMRFVTGSSLSKAIKELHKPDEQDQFHTRLRSLLARFQSVCNTIEYAHSRNVIHRDLKPDNIMMGGYGENLVVDWGLAKSLKTQGSENKTESVTQNQQSNSHTRIGSVVGTPYYMSPEQASGESTTVGPQSDVYSLGATLYEILTGHAPFRDQNIESVMQLLRLVREGKPTRPRELNPRIPKPLEAICLAAMETKSERRYESAAQIAIDIEQFLADGRVSVAKETFAERVGRWSRKHRSWTLAIGASVLAIALATSLASVVTLRALNATEVANEKLTNQLTLARLEQEFDEQILREEKRLNEKNLSQDAMVISGELLGDLQEKLVEIDRWRPLVDVEFAADIPRRQRLLNMWGSSINSILSQPSFTLDVEEFSKAQISTLTESYRWPHSLDFKDQIRALQDKLQSRQGAWRPLAFEGYPDDTFVSAGDFWQRRSAESSDDWPILIADCPSGDISFEATFDETSLSAAMIGLVMNASDSQSYRFVLAEKDFDPTYMLPDAPKSLKQLNEAGRLWMHIIRQDDEFEFTKLRSAPINLTTPITLRARRDGLTRLTFSAVGHNTIDFDDPFPISISKSGKFGVICPPRINVSEPVISYHELSRELDYAPDPIMLGDAKMAEGDVDAARAEYERLPDDVEARFKLAISYEGEDAELTESLREIVYKYSQESSTDDRAKRWYLLAAVRLIKSYLDSGKTIPASELQDRLSLIYSAEEIRELVPAAYKQSFLESLVKPGQRWRIAYVNQGDADSLQRSADLFSDSPQLRRHTLWRWCDAIRCDLTTSEEQGRSSAIPVMKDLVREVRELSSRNELEYTTLVSDLVWMLLVEGNEDEALEYLKPHLEMALEDVPIEHLPLVIERARIAYRRRDLATAKKDLEHVVATIDPKKPQPGIHYAHYSEACGLLGMIHEDQEKPELAQEVWLKGRRRNWHKGVPPADIMVHLRGEQMVLEDQAIDEVLVSWTDGYTDEMFEAVLESIFGGSGIEEQALLSTIKNSDTVPRPWMKLISESLFKGTEGKAAGRDYLTRSRSMRGITTYGARTILYQAVVQITFDRGRYLSIHPDVEKVVHRNIAALVDKYQEQAFSQKYMVFILGAWCGKTWNSRRFDELAELIDDSELSTSMAFIFALQMMKRDGNANLAREIVEKYVYPEKDNLPEFYFTIIDDVIPKEQETTAQP